MNAHPIGKTGKTLNEGKGFFLPAWQKKLLDARLILESEKAT